MQKNGLTLRKILLELDKIKTIQYPGSEEKRLLNPLTRQQKKSMNFWKSCCQSV